MFKIGIAKSLGAVVLAGLVTAGGSAALANGDGADGPARRFPRIRFAKAMIHEVTEQTGLTPCEVLEDLSGGQTFGQILDDKGVSSSLVFDGMVDHLETRLERALENERITEERAEIILDRFDEAFEKALEADLSRFATRVYDNRCTASEPEG